MLNYAPIARIMIRYGVGTVAGNELATALAGDMDVINYTALAIGAIVAAGTEYFYSKAVKLGWAT